MVQQLSLQLSQSISLILPQQLKIYKCNSAVVVTDLLSKYIDSNYDSLIFQGVDSASKGTVTVTNAQLDDTSYTPSTLIAYTSKPLNGIWSITDSFNYKCSDSLVTSTETVSVTITNTPPTCVNKTKIVTRDYNNPNVQITSTELLIGTTNTNSDSLSNNGAIDFSADIKSKNQALNTQDFSPKITNITPLQQVGTISNSLVYTPTKTHSCTENICYVIYEYSNSAGQKSTCKIIINQLNTAPTTPNRSYTYSARRDGTFFSTL